MTDDQSSARKPADEDPERTLLAPTTPGTGTERSQILTQPFVDIELPATQGEAPAAAQQAPVTGPRTAPPSAAGTPVEIPASGTPVTTVPEAAKGVDRAAGPSSNVLPVGTRLAEFEVISVIGEGGFGIVYRAVDHSLRRIVALKEYMPAALASRLPDFSVSVKSAQHAETFRAGLRSFINEARLLARFDHQALVKVYRFWEANGTAYMVMPMYEGGTLKQTLKQRGRPADEAWLRQLLAPLLDAIELLHKAECLHRDIAPDNVILVGGETSPLRPVLLDFGAARRVISEHTQALTVILKPGFAPIEQYDEIPGMKQGPWTDLYALAAVLHYAMAGKPPPPSVGRMVHDSQVPLVESMRGRYSEAFLAAIDRALEPRPDARPRNVAEFRRLLAGDLPVQRGGPAPEGADTAPAAAPGPRGAEPAGPPSAAPAGAPRTVATPESPVSRTVVEPKAPERPTIASDEPTLPPTPTRPMKPATSQLEPPAAAMPAAFRAATEPATRTRTVAAPGAEAGTSIESLAARWKAHLDKPVAGAPPPANAADDTLRALLEGTRQESRAAPAGATAAAAGGPGAASAPSRASGAATAPIGASGAPSEPSATAALPSAPAPSGPAGAQKKRPPWVTALPTEEPAAPPRRSAAKWFVVGMGVLAAVAAAFVLVVPRLGQQQAPVTAEPATSPAPGPAPAPQIAMPAAAPSTAAQPPVAGGAAGSTTAPLPPTASSGLITTGPKPPVSASPEKAMPPKKKLPPQQAAIDPVKAAPVGRTPPMAGAAGDESAGQAPRPAWMQRAMREARECLVARDFACTIQRAETVLASEPEHPAAQRLLKLGRQGQEAALSSDWKMR